MTIHDLPVTIAHCPFILTSHYYPLTIHYSRLNGSPPTDDY